MIDNDLNELNLYHNCGLLPFQVVPQLQYCGTIGVAVHNLEPC